MSKISKTSIVIRVKGVIYQMIPKFSRRKLRKLKTKTKYQMSDSGCFRDNHLEEVNFIRNISDDTDANEGENNEEICVN